MFLASFERVVITAIVVCLTFMKIMSENKLGFEGYFQDITADKHDIEMDLNFLAEVILHKIIGEISGKALLRLNLDLYG